MMEVGAMLALHEVALVVFSTLTPAGAVACSLLSLLSIYVRDEGSRTRLRHLVGLPLAVATAGLVTASTHLGTPANVLYVVDGIGRSPLSNEMLCTLPFLALAGIFWLYSFSVKPRRRLLDCLGAGVAALGCVCVAGIAAAYRQPTIPAWNSPLTVAGIALGAVVAGVPLFLLAAHIARTGRSSQGFERAALYAGASAAVLNLVCEVMRYTEVQGMGNEMFSAVELSPQYPWYIVGFSLLAAAAYALCIAACSKRNEPPGGEEGARRASFTAALSRHRCRCLVLAAVLALLGFFLLRFAFYTLHFTVGIG